MGNHEQWQAVQNNHGLQRVINRTCGIPMSRLTQQSFFTLTIVVNSKQ